MTSMPSNCSEDSPESLLNCLPCDEYKFGRMYLARMALMAAARANKTAIVEESCHACEIAYNVFVWFLILAGIFGECF